MAPLDSPQPTPSIELIVYQLGQLQATTEQGFKGIDGRLGAMEARVSSTETRLTVVETKQGFDLTKILVAVGALLAAALAGNTAPGIG